jgi:hypothetical protein
MRTLRGFQTLRAAVYALAMLLVPVYYMGCATVQTGGWGSDPIPAMTASVMSAKPCSPPAFRDPSPNVNRQNGWFSTVPAGSDLPACGKAETPYYCQNRAGCGEFTYGTRFVGGGREPRHVFIDLLAGTVKACLQPAQRFGVGGLECQRKLYSAANGPVRVVLESVLAGADSSTELSASISAEPGSPVAIGQIGPVEPR